MNLRRPVAAAAGRAAQRPGPRKNKVVVVYGSQALWLLGISLDLLDLCLPRSRSNVCIKCKMDALALNEHVRAVSKQWRDWILPIPAAFTAHAAILQAVLRADGCQICSTA